MFVPAMTESLSLIRLERSATGDVTEASAVAVLGIVSASDETVVAREGISAPIDAVIHLAADAPIDVGHSGWRIRHDGRDLDVVSIRAEKNHATGQIDHWRLLTVRGR